MTQNLGGLPHGLVVPEFIIRAAKQEVDRDAPNWRWRFAGEKSVGLCHRAPTFQFTSTPRINTLPPPERAFNLNQKALDKCAIHFSAGLRILPGTGLEANVVESFGRPGALHKKD